MCLTDLPDLLQAAAKQAKDGYLGETRSNIEGRIRILDERITARLGEIVDDPAAYGLARSSVKRDWEDDELTKDELWGDKLIGQDVVFKFQKSEVPGTARFWFAEIGLGAALRKGVLTGVSVIEVVGEFEAIRTAQGPIQPWGADTRHGPPPRTASIASTHETVRFVEQSVGPPTCIGFLLPTSEDSGAHSKAPVAEIWRRAAADVLPLALASELWRRDGDTVCVVRGPVTREATFQAGDAVSSELLSLMCSAAAWIYTPTEQAEVRHGLLSSELARQWPRTESPRWTKVLAERLRTAYETARTSYQLHIQGHTAESLRALGDLRKALIEESARVQKCVTELLSSLWRDFLVVVGGLITHYIALDDDRPGSRSWILWACIAFVLANGSLTFWGQGRTMHLAKRSFETWKNRVYTYVSNEDYDELAGKPISAVRNLYLSVAVPVSVLYVAMLGALVFALYSQPVSRESTDTTLWRPQQTEAAHAEHQAVLGGMRSKGEVPTRASDGDCA